MSFILSISIILFGLWYTHKNQIKSFNLLVLLYLITPPAIAFPFSFLGISFVFSPARLYMISFILSFLFTVNKRKYSLIKTKADKVLQLLIIYLLLSFIWGINLQYDIKIFISEQFLLSFIAYFMALRIYNDNDTLISFLKTISLGIVILFIYGIIEMIFKQTISSLPFIKSLSGLDITNSNFIHTTIGQRGGYYRVSGTFWNNIIYGIALTMFFPFLLLIKSSKKSKVFKTAFFSSIVGGLLTISRTAWFSLLMVISFNIKKHRVLALISIFTFFFILLPFLNVTFQNSDYIDRKGTDIYSRLVVLKPVFTDLKIKDIVLGYGVGSYLYFNLNKDKNTTYIRRLPSDNTFAQRVFITGLIGVVIFFLFFYYYFRELKLYTNRQSIFESNLVKATGQMIIVQLSLFLLSNSLFQDPRLTLVFFSLLGAVKGVVVNNKTI